MILWWEEGRWGLRGRKLERRWKRASSVKFEFGLFRRLLSGARSKGFRWAIYYSSVDDFHLAPLCTSLHRCLSNFLQLQEIKCRPWRVLQHRLSGCVWNFCDRFWQDYGQSRKQSEASRNVERGGSSFLSSDPIVWTRIQSWSEKNWKRSSRLILTPIRNWRKVIERIGDGLTWHRFSPNLSKEAILHCLPYFRALILKLQRD